MTKANGARQAWTLHPPGAEVSSTVVDRQGERPGTEVVSFGPWSFVSIRYLEGVWQSGKKVLATILDVCPLVALWLGLKYGRLPGGTQGSPMLPHG
jgi:hypothetical protein